MVGKEYSPLDHFLIRAKDVGVICGVAGAIFLWSGKLSVLPARVDASEKEIAGIKEQIKINSDKLIEIQSDIKYLVKSMDELKSGAVRL